MATVPTVPNIVPLPRAQDSSIEFWWNPPSSDGGSALTGYTVSCSTPQLQYVYPPSAFNAWIRGLTNGDNYTFFITASNAIGESEPATWQPYQPGFVPSPPTGVVASRQGTSCNLQVSRDIPVSTNTVRYWSAQAVPADSGYTTVVQSEYGENVTTVIPNLNMNETQWQVTARQLTDPGWSDPSAKTPYIGENRVKSVFITNMSQNNMNIRPTVDSNGNFWGISQARSFTLSTFLYNARGELVQGIGPYSAGYSFLYYSTADGVTNTWLAQIYGQITISSADENPGFIDGNGNFGTCLGIGSTDGSIRIFDKRGVLISSNRTPTGFFAPVFMKVSPTGIYNGSSDSNTWAAYTSCTTLSLLPRCVQMDSSGNLFASAQYNNTSGLLRTFQMLDKFGTPIGSTITSVIGSYPVVWMKMASDGTATNSWIAHYSNILGGFTYYSQTFKINQSNELIVAARFQGANGFIYDKNYSTIGASLPYISTPGYINQQSLLVKFGVNGLSNSSWRAIQYGIGPLYKDLNPYSINIDSSANIILSGYAEARTDQANIIPLSSSDTSNAAVTQSTFALNNTYHVRYTSSGTPEWITTIQGASNAAANLSTMIDTTQAKSGPTNYTIRNVLDSNNNLFVSGQYQSNVLNVYNKNGSLINQISSPLSNVNVFITKFSADGTTGSVARLGSISTVNSSNTSNFHFRLGQSNQVIIAGTNQANLFGFYPSSNIQRPTFFVSSLNNIFRPQGYAAYVDNGLSTCSLSRWDIDSTNVIPYRFAVDSDGACVAFNEYRLGVSSAPPIRVFCLGNHTTTPSFFYSNTTQGNNCFVTKVTSNTNTSWTANILGTSGNTGSGATFIASSSSPNALFIGSLNITANNRIVTLSDVSSVTSTIILDKNTSTITTTGPIFGSRATFSSIVCAVSFPPDGVNRPQ